MDLNSQKCINLRESPAARCLSSAEIKWITLESAECPPVGSADEQLACDGLLTGGGAVDQQYQATKAMLNYGWKTVEIL